MLSERLAAQVPAWPPGTRHGYHGVTLGWYQSELIRHVDPRRAHTRQVLRRRDRRAARAGLPHRVAGLRWTVIAWRICTCRRKIETMLHLNTLPLMLTAAWFIPMPFDGASKRRYSKGPTAFRRSTGKTSVSSRSPPPTGRAPLNRWPSSTATPPPAALRLGLNPEVFSALTAPPVTPTEGTARQGVACEHVYSLGFGRPIPKSTKYVIGSSDKAFGAPGAGGSVGFADPDTGVGFGYVMNELGFHLISDPRATRLRQALFRDVLGARSQT